VQRNYVSLPLQLLVRAVDFLANAAHDNVKLLGFLLHSMQNVVFFDDQLHGILSDPVDLLRGQKLAQEAVAAENRLHVDVLVELRVQQGQLDHLVVDHVDDPLLLLLVDAALLVELLDQI